MPAVSPLEIELGRRLTAAGQTLATAESCSGGLIAHRITNVPGSSAYYLGGFVTYSNAAKTDLLGVREADLATYGAVSERVALGMSAGARQRMGADWAVGVTGIAGPSGGSPDKPVGLVYIAVTGPDGSRVTEHRFEGDREEIKARTAERALALLLEQME